MVSSVICSLLAKDVQIIFQEIDTANTIFRDLDLQLQKALDRCQNLGIWESGNDFTATVPVPKSSENHLVKNQLFMFLPPACFETGFGFDSGFEAG